MHENELTHNAFIGIDDESDESFMVLFLFSLVLVKATLNFENCGDCSINPKAFKPNRKQPILTDAQGNLLTTENGKIIVREGEFIKSICEGCGSNALFTNPYEVNLYTCVQGIFTNGEHEIKVESLSCNEKVQPTVMPTGIKCEDSGLLFKNGFHTPDGFKTLMTCCHNPETNLTHWVDYDLQVAGNNSQDMNSTDRRLHPANYVSEGNFDL